MCVVHSIWFEEEFKATNLNVKRCSTLSVLTIKACVWCTERSRDLDRYLTSVQVSWAGRRWGGVGGLQGQLSCLWTKHRWFIERICWVSRSIRNSVLQIRCLWISTVNYRLSYKKQFFKVLAQNCLQTLRSIFFILIFTVCTYPFLIFTITFLFFL